MSLRLALAAALVLTLSACGTSKAGSAVEVAATTIDGHAVAKLGFGAEGGEKPALVRRAKGGFALAYAATRVGQRRIHVSTSPDGTRWGKAQVACPGDFSDQAPALAEDQDGKLHLFFASNRSGETQALYHAVEAGAAFGEPTEVAGFEGVQDLAVAAGDAGFTLVAEVMGAGLLAATSTDGTTWSKAAEVAPAGAEPAACALPDGRTLVAYQLEGKIKLQAGKDGKWAAATDAATGASRLRDPGLAWAGAAGLLVYSEKGESGMELHARTLDPTAPLPPTPRTRGPATTGGARSPSTITGQGPSLGV